MRLFWPRWLFRVRCEREAIAETRPSAAILAAMAGARRSEQPALREAIAMARRRDALDLELAAFEKRLPENPAGCDGRYPQPC